MEQVSQSLAGRTGILHLLPLGRSELERETHGAPADDTSLFAGGPSNLDLWDTLFRGFYPRIHDAAIPPEIWYSDYTETYVQRDLRSLVNIGDLERFERFLALTAGRTGQLLNYTSLANDAGMFDALVWWCVRGFPCEHRLSVAGAGIVLTIEYGKDDFRGLLADGVGKRIKHSLEGMSPGKYLHPQTQLLDRC